MTCICGKPGLHRPRVKQVLCDQCNFIDVWQNRAAVLHGRKDLSFIQESKGRGSTVSIICPEKEYYTSEVGR